MKNTNIFDHLWCLPQRYSGPMGNLLLFLDAFLMILVAVTAAGVGGALMYLAA